jgi:hypothetical protein
MPALSLMEESGRAREAVQMHPLVRSLSVASIQEDDRQRIRVSAAERLGVAYRNNQRLCSEYRGRGAGYHGGSSENPQWFGRSHRHRVERSDGTDCPSVLRTFSDGASRLSKHGWKARTYGRSRWFGTSLELRDGGDSSLSRGTNCQSNSPLAESFVGGSGAWASRQGLDHEHATLVTERAFPQRRAGEFFIALGIILAGF